MRIDTRLSSRLKKINPSSTLAITSKAKKLKSEGVDVISLAAGEPDFDTPDFIKDAAIEAIRSGFTKYTPSTGTAELKKLICDKFKKDNALDYRPEQIVVSCGAKHSIYNTLLVLLNKGDEVLIPLPYWVSYPEMVHLCDGVVRFINTAAQDNFKMTPKELKKHIGPKSKVLILNSPSNPTGCVYSKDELEAIADICVSEKIFVLSDEIYEKLIYSGLKHHSIASFNEKIYSLTVTVNGLSKSFSMTGWRIGYIGAPVDVAEAVSRLQDHSTSNPTSISQKAAEAALKAPDDFCRAVCAEFEKRWDYCVKRINSMKNISCVIPQGAFYIFCDISKTRIPSQDLARRLLDEAHIALIPGDSFGRDDCVRISFATSLPQLEHACDRLQAWLAKNT